MELLQKVQAGFKQAFNEQPAFIVNAPGRVNLIGEHTDYNDGFVLPCAIEYSTLIAVSPRDDKHIVVASIDYDLQQDTFSVDGQIDFVENKMWANYVRGVVAEFLKRDHSLQGCNIAITGNVPQGAGLSSSAALEVGIAQALSHINGLNIDKAELALIGQAAENNFVGCACGIMDQLISAKGKDQTALCIDCRTLETFDVSIPDHMSILIINSNVKRGLVDSEYNVRRQQCEQAAKHFEVSHLRDVSIEQFEQRAEELDEVVAKRAKHVVYENHRTLDAMQAFNKGDVANLSQLMAQSHASMRDLFEITTHQIDYLVEIVSDILGDKGGVRMTGGGFGGCVVALVPNDLLAQVQQEIEDKYQAKTGLKEVMYITKPVKGVCVL